MCFHRTVGFVLDVPPARLCVGTFRAATEEELREVPHASAVPFVHCWAEIGSKVYAPTTIEATGGRLMPFDRREYYDRNGTKDVKVMLRSTLRQLSGEYGLADHLLYHTPVRGDRAFSDVILDSMGVNYTVTEQESVVPTGE